MVEAGARGNNQFHPPDSSGLHATPPQPFARPLVEDMETHKHHKLAIGPEGGGLIWQL